MNVGSRIPPIRQAPEEVLDAAAAAFMAKGYLGTTLDDVARHMGATKGRIYHYFQSKSELLHAVQTRAMDKNFAAIRPAFESAAPPVEKFRAMAFAHALNMMVEQAYQKALFDGLHYHITRAKNGVDCAQLDGFLAARRAFEDMFREVLCEGRKSGEFQFATLSTTLHTVITILNATLYWYSARPGDAAEKQAEIAGELVAMALGALGVSNINKEG